MFSCTSGCACWGSQPESQGRVDDFPGLFLHLLQVCLGNEGFGVDLVYVFRAGGAGGEPRVIARDLQTADRGAVPRGFGELRRDVIAGEGGGGDGLRGEPRERGLLIPGRGRVESGVPALAVPFHQRCVANRGRLPGDRRDLRGEEGEDDAVLVRRPYAAIAAKE